MTNNYLNVGFNNKPPSECLVVVGMSGGVDSSVTASLMHLAGYKVVGVTLQLSKAEKQIKSCCSDKDIQDAQDVALGMGFTHYTVDYHENFKKHVVDDFVDEYMNGHTPSPCVRCNQHVKFGDLLNFARDLGADGIATGHYIAHKINDDSEVEFHKAIDETKDQTYFMSMVKRENMPFIRFPLGIYHKHEVRKIAEELNLAVAKKKDSQDLCFIQNGSYRDILKKLAKEENKGFIVDSEDNILGYHGGIENYTVGQRKGIDIKNGPWFVLKIIASENKVVIGRQEELMRTSFKVDSINPMVKEFPKSMFAKIRSQHNPIKCTLEGDTVHLEEPAYSVTPGQICAFYNYTQLLGGCRIIA